jgi:hypothetical protein
MVGAVYGIKTGGFNRFHPAQQFGRTELLM